VVTGGRCREADAEVSVDRPNFCTCRPPPDLTRELEKKRAIPIRRSIIAAGGRYRGAGMGSTGPRDDDTARLLGQVRGGDAAALDRLLELHRPIMHRAVEARMDPRLLRRFDPSDVVQDAQAEVARRIHDYLARQPMPFRLWLRQTACESLLRLQRRHRRAGRRSVDREVSLPDRSSAEIGRLALAAKGSAGERLIEAELAQRTREALARLSDADREVLVMRGYEGLSNAEVAATLGIEPVAASQRFGRAVLRLRNLLAPEGGRDD
jgi:RNA polymerase sigma-70 factor (ECF subfamily)